MIGNFTINDCHGFVATSKSEYACRPISFSFAKCLNRDNLERASQIRLSDIECTIYFVFFSFFCLDHCGSKLWKMVNSYGFGHPKLLQMAET